MDPHLGLREWVKVRKKQTGRYFLCSTAACEGATKKIVVTEKLIEFVQKHTVPSL